MKFQVNIGFQAGQGVQVISGDKLLQAAGETFTDCVHMIHAIIVSSTRLLRGPILKIVYTSVYV